MIRSSYLFALLFLFALAPRVFADSRPNIIFLLADDQCTYSMGCYGTPNVKTPNMDSLARDGMTFDSHYDTTAICMASRVNIMTGMFEYKTGCNFDHGPLLTQHWKKTYPILLKETGYQTAFAGKFGFEIAEKPTQRRGVLPEDDFDRWGGGPGQTNYATKKNKSMAKYAKQYPHSTLSYGAFARDFIRDAGKSDKPFCLSVSFKAPHMPATPDPQFNDVYAGASFVKPKNYGRRYGEHFSLQSKQGRQFERFHSWNYSDKYDKVMATYYQQIYAIDVALGMIRKTLAETEQTNDTVIIYTSDNGFLCGSHGYGSKVLPYEEASRVPLIIYDPRHKNSGRQLRCSRLTGNVDFAPTILRLAGLPVPTNVDGKDLMQLYDDPNSAFHDYLPLINVWGPKKVNSLAIVTEKWKYIHWPFSEGDFERAEELYNLGEDRLERTNLIADELYVEKRKEMRAIYDQTVKNWQKDAVPYHDYQRFGKWFERK